MQKMVLFVVIFEISKSHVLAKNVFNYLAKPVAVFRKQTNVYSTFYHYFQDTVFLAACNLFSCSTVPTLSWTAALFTVGTLSCGCRMSC